MKLLNMERSVINVFFIMLICFTDFIHSFRISSIDAIRNSVIEKELLLSTGGGLTLSPKEQEVNEYLMKYKNQELALGLNSSDKLASGMHFFHAKPLIDQSKVFKFLQLMPKGGLLHGHNTAMVSSEWVIKNLTYHPDLLKCINKNGITVLSFRKIEKHNCDDYVKVIDERYKSKNNEFYDSMLEKSFNMYTLRPEVEYPNVDVAWKKFQNMFTTVNDMIRYLPAFKAYHYRLLEELYNDGIFYIELRYSFAAGYDLNGPLTSAQMTQELLNVIKDFKNKHSDFLEMKAIFTAKRKITQEQLLKQMLLYRELKIEFPEFIIGFDLVGQEDLGYPLYYFDNLLKSMPAGTKFFFHAGETNWYGADADYNLLDAILLNTTRIAHGYALAKHPVLWNAVKNSDIAIEINPISNQVLHLVQDLRNHPAAFYISENIPIVIAHDDPGFWNAKGLSYDFYFAFMSFASNLSGLNFLKQLALNSIKYTVMTLDERLRATEIFERQWDNFLNNILNSPDFNLY